MICGSIFFSRLSCSIVSASRLIPILLHLHNYSASATHFSNVTHSASRRCQKRQRRTASVADARAKAPLRLLFRATKKLIKLDLKVSRSDLIKRDEYLCALSIEQL